MTVADIYSQIAQRMIEGLMTHSQLADYFGFLGFKGYQEQHIYHYFEENKNYKCIAKYYLEHYNKLLIEQPFKNPNVIPEDQYQFSRQQVSDEVRRTALIAGIERQVYQERETKSFYEQKYDELVHLSEIAGAEEVKKYIIDVDYELAEAEQMHLELLAINFSMEDIVIAQEDIRKKYHKKMKEITLC